MTTAELLPHSNVDHVSSVADDRSDSLTTGVLFLLGLTVIQRLVGFIRSIAFCGILHEDQLGRWSLSQSFLLMAAPLALLGIPGSFGRYFEHFRRKGQQRVFLRRTTLVSLTLSAALVTAVLCFPSHFAQLIFSDAAQKPLVQLLAVTLAAVIVFNFQVELLTAMRRVRLVSLMQLINGLSFAAVGLTLVWLADWKEAAVVVAFGIGSLAGSLVCVLPLIRSWSRMPLTSEQPSLTGFWSKLLPFAAWIWVSDALFNLFDAADRFMIVHFAPAATQGEALVGQYHSSRVVPMLLVAVAAMLSGVLLPYLSHDWEAGRRELVSQRLKLGIKLTGVGLTFGGLLILACSPLLFSWLLHGRYDDGLRVLPGTLVYCLWFGLLMIAQNYLFCAEKSRLGSLAMLIGLILNIILNRSLLPYWGLPGAVFATAVANGLSLAGVVFFATWCGLKVDVGTIVICCLPLSLLLGVWGCLASLIAVIWAMPRWRALLSEQERHWLVETAGSYWQRLRRT